MEDREYLLINDIHILGKFLIHYGSLNDHPNQECMRAVLKVNKKGNNHYLFTPGYRTFNQQYFQCPLTTIYTQLNWIENKEEENISTLKAEIVVFSKNFKQTRVINFSQTLANRGSKPSLNPMRLNGFVNAINCYIDAGYEINLLDVNYLENTINIPKLYSVDLLKMINMLEFEFFSNDQSRVV